MPTVSAVLGPLVAGALLAGAVGAADATAAGPATGWSHGTVVGRAGSNALGDEYSLPRVALSADGRGTVVWGRWAGGSTVGLVETLVRDLRADGSLGPATSLRRIGHVAVARDGDGHPVVSGVDGSRPWLATRTARGTWTQRTTGGNPAWVFGQATGFSLLTGRGSPSITGPYALRTVATPAARPFGDPVRLAPELTPDDGADDHTWDGSNVAQLPGGTVVTAGWRFSSGKAAAYPQPTSSGAPVLITFIATPTAVPLVGDPDFGASAIDNAGDHVALAGLHERPAGAQRQAGYVEYAVGTSAGLTPIRRVPGVPKGRGMEVDVAARPDGGAVVTWVQEQAFLVGARRGVPHWAQISPAGEVESQGTFSAGGYAAHVRIVRVGGAYVAVWSEGIGRRAAVRSARLDGTRVTALRTPDGTPPSVNLADSSTQLVASGERAAFVFPNRTDHTIRVATLRIRS